MGDFFATINAVSLVDVLVPIGCAFLLTAFGSLFIEYLRLKKRFAQAEADLFERTVGTQSRNWTNTAQSLEQKAKEPGEVARSSAMTYLHMLDESADAYMKGSQWQDALRVTQQLLSESCHAIAKPGISESVFRATADLIELRLTTYPDLSKAANEATENASRFLIDLDTTLWITDQSVRVTQLRDLIADVKLQVEAQPARANTKAKAKAEKPKLADRIMSEERPKLADQEPPKAVEKTAAIERPKLESVTKRAIAAPPLRPMPILGKPQTP